MQLMSTLGDFYDGLVDKTAEDPQKIDRLELAMYFELAIPLENQGKKAKSPGKGKAKPSESTDSETIANDTPLNDTERADHFMTLFAVVLVARCHPSSVLTYNYVANDGKSPGFIE